jgi:hypothetical protein
MNSKFDASMNYDDMDQVEKSYNWEESTNTHQQLDNKKDVEKHIHRIQNSDFEEMGALGEDEQRNIPAKFNFCYTTIESYGTFEVKDCSQNSKRFINKLALDGFELRGRGSWEC